MKKTHISLDQKQHVQSLKKLLESTNTTNVEFAISFIRGNGFPEEMFGYLYALSLFYPNPQIYKPLQKPIKRYA